MGGGAAGLNGALMLARSRRSVLVIDAGHHATLRPALCTYCSAVTGCRRASRSPERSIGLTDGGGLVVELADGRSTTARRLLVTTGLVDELPNVAGLAERWGRGVIHCPYCHGWEVCDQAIEVLATGPTAAHQALLLRQLSDDVVVFTHAAELSELVDDLGLAAVEHPMGIGWYLAADPIGLTAFPGVYVAGNVSDLMAQVGAAAAAGALAGARSNADLVEEEADDALAISVPTTDASARALLTH